MIEWLKYGLVFIAGTAFVAIYYKIARRLNLLDHPTTRSSHTAPTLLGVGILYPFVFILSIFLFAQPNPYLLSGLALGAITGFLDDKFELSALIRTALYGICVMLVLYTIPGKSLYQYWHIVAILIIALGTVNAYNFMDGINGISIIYTVVFILSILLIIHLFDYKIPTQILWVCLTPCAIIGFLNVRTHALAFMGDVGSVFLGLFATYWIIYLTTYAWSPVYILLLLLYGVDSVITIVERLIKSENIFTAHRLHLYQLLSNELKWPHLKVAILYGSLQLLINLMLIYSVLNDWNGVSTLICTMLVTGGIYLIVKYWLVYPAVRLTKSKLTSD